MEQLDSPPAASGIPWGSLRYLIEEVMYGGRVMDSYDRRVLHTYMAEYFGDFLFDKCQKFHFYKGGSVEYCIPGDTSREGLLGELDAVMFCLTRAS